MQGSLFLGYPGFTISGTKVGWPVVLDPAIVSNSVRLEFGGPLTGPVIDVIFRVYLGGSNEIGSNDIEGGELVYTSSPVSVPQAFYLVDAGVLAITGLTKVQIVCSSDGVFAISPFVMKVTPTGQVPVTPPDVDPIPPDDPGPVTLPTPGLSAKVGTNFWDLGWGIWDEVIATDDFATTTNPWQSAFLADITPYAAYRFMDFGRVNGSTEVNWANRTQKTSPLPDQFQLAYEWMIDLCNRKGKHMWVCIPHLATADYAFQLATLIKAQLNPSLKCYVEWSNETWNGIFDQTHYSYDQGNLLSLDPDPWSAAFKYHVYAAVRAFHQFDLVFSGSSSSRIVKILAGQSEGDLSAPTWLAELHLDALLDPVINPSNVQIQAYAIAPYFGIEVADGAAPSAIGEMAVAVTKAIAEVRVHHTLVTGRGLQLLGYEGGQHVYQSNADVVNARPEMYQLYTDYLNGITPYFNLFMHYLHNGGWGSTGAWGACQYIGQPLPQVHKLRALFDWISSH